IPETGAAGTDLQCAHFKLIFLCSCRGNFTVPKLSESNMGFGVLGVFLGLLLEVSTHGPHSVPRTSWKRQDLDLLEFSEPGIFNYSTLLLSEERDALYVGAREAIFELNKRDVTVRNQKNLEDFSMEGQPEDGRGKCSFDPSQSFTAVMVEPSFVFADVIRAGKHKGDGEDDKIYYFFTEVSVEYEFFGKLLIPRVARVWKYMQKATVEQSHTKWVRYNGIPPSPRPGAVSGFQLSTRHCINNQMRQQNISSSLHLPDKTLQFVRDHPLLEDPVLPIGNRPRLITKDVNYTQLVVERVHALDGNIYDVIFSGTDSLSIVCCRRLIQSLNGDAEKCPSVSLKDYQKVLVKPGSSTELPCVVNSNLAHVMWKSNGSLLNEASRFHFIAENGLLIYSVAAEDQGYYECWSVEWAPAAGKNFSRLLAGYMLNLDLPPRTPPQTNHVATTVSSQETSNVHGAEGNVKTERQPLTSASFTSTALLTSPLQTDPSLTLPPSGTVRLQSSRNLPPNSVIPRPDGQDPAAEYLQHNNSMALLFLFLLFFLLFLAAMVYNCYMQYLPAPCLRLRAILLGSHKCTHQPEYRACEAGLMEVSATDKINMTEQPALNGSQAAKNLQALRDTGYETEPECGNGRIPSHNFGGDSPSQEKPFDVDCDSQSIQFADEDEPYS
ncbi:hypothetical protein GOODEAATRI_012175, partial [Goodea atripinnis]